MPPKGKDAKKGAPVGNYKAGKLLKDIVPLGTKPPREGVPVKLEGEPDVHRTYLYEPYPKFPDWPASNEEAKQHDYSSGFIKDEQGNQVKFIDNTPIYLPPSFKEFEKGDLIWMRPEEYLREVAYDNEYQKRRAERKSAIKKKKTIRKQSILAIGESPTIDELQSQMTVGGKAINDEKIAPINKDDLNFEVQCIQYDTRLENEEELKKRKEEAEKLAALDKNAKKKPPAKGQQPVADPMDEPQLIKVPVENTMDMGFLMPLYCKWATSQFQFIKDRSIRDCDTRESIWQRIYPQENGIPVVSPSGKYWVKVRFQGKERLVEIDDRMPCDSKHRPLLPRTVANFEIWPQLLMKAILKVYSYKWFQANAHYDNEVGDGSIVYSLSGLIPEPISIKDFDNDGMALLRRVLSDDHYFNKKTYVTCFCDNDYRPKLPSQAGQTTLKQRLDGAGGNQKMEGGQSVNGDDMSEPSSANTIQSSAGKMLGRLRDAATMAISVTTGKKLTLNKNANSTNIITGFGYALLDIFENQYVDMDSIVKKKDEIEEVKSPFMSPSRRRREKGISKDEWKKKRRDEKKKEQEERERREKEPPKQYSLIKIKTSVGKYPVMNYLSQFTNDEIQEGKRCLLNHIRRAPEPEKFPESPMSLKANRGGAEAGVFHLNIQQLDQSQKNAAANEEEKKQQDEHKDLIDPKTRAAGGVWLASSDFPQSFQHLIVYHNINKYTNIQNYADKWADISQPYISNEKDIVIKLELDEEALKQQRALQINNREFGFLDISARTHNDKDKEKSYLVNESRIDAGSPIKPDDGVPLLPGEVLYPHISHDQILIAYAPYPTSKPQEVLPRYLMRMQQLDYKSNDQSLEDNVDIYAGTNKAIDFTIRSYFEAKFLALTGALSDQHTIWLKPNIMAPQGFQLWAASLVRKISIVSRSDYLLQQKGYFMKNYQSDFLPIEKGKYHLFGKFDFQVQQEDTKLNLKIDIPNDKYLLKYMRVKLIDKSDRNHIMHQQTLNQTKIENLQVQPNNGKGYCLLIEGVMPYNTTEGQLQLEVLCNKDNFALEEVQQVEPLEYTDKYYPSKYGIIFKEKIYVGVDHTTASLNIKLRKEGKDFDKIEGMKKLFRIEVLDQGKTIFTKEGYNQITVSHFMFRSNQGLPESSENPNDEVKHQYVVQALFDLHEWPQSKNENSESQDVSWHLKLFSSETLGTVKDTDKEDKEKALKASWEANEPGRAEKAKRSRQKFILQQRLRNGEQLTEEEMTITKEVRERIRKKDEIEDPKAKGGKAAPGKAPPPKGKEDPKAKGGKAPVPVPEEAEDKNKKPLPEPSSHVNNEIREFLQHFKSDRLIHIQCDKHLARKREEQEKQSLMEQRQVERERAQQEIEEMTKDREQQKEDRIKFKQAVFSDIEQSRQEYKEKLQQVFTERNKYRDMIASRKDKDKNLQDIIAQDKIDLNFLQKAIDEAKENLVREEVIVKGEKYLVWLKYCKDFETQLQQALAEKNKENLLAVLDKIDKEGIVMEPKMLTDAKNTLSKMK